jgi:hypothetical protein
MLEERGGEGRRGGRSQIIQWREHLILYNPYINYSLIY